MAILLTSYAVVATGRPLPPMELEDLDPDTESYLEEHVAALVGRAAKSPPTSFLSTATRDAFSDLAQGSDEDFLSRARELAARLLGEMDGRTPDGFFVAARTDAVGGERRAVVLKLQVKAAHAGYLRRRRGRTHLSAVRDSLDAPGQLQKGAIFKDVRPESDMLVGDQLDVGALYFLRALGLTQQQNPRAALTAVMRAVGQRAPGALAAAGRAMARRQPETVTEALDAIEQEAPEVRPWRQEIETELRGQKRPSVRVDPHVAAGIKRVIKAHGVEIVGPVVEVDERVRVSETDDGRWQATVTFDVRPDDYVVT